MALHLTVRRAGNIGIDIDAKEDPRGCEGDVLSPRLRLAGRRYAEICGREERAITSSMLTTHASRVVGPRATLWATASGVRRRSVRRSTRRREERQRLLAGGPRDLARQKSRYRFGLGRWPLLSRSEGCSAGAASP